MKKLSIMRKVGPSIDSNNLIMKQQKRNTKKKLETFMASPGAFSLNFLK